MVKVRDLIRPPAAWDPDALRDPHGRPDKADRVRTMFDAIAPTYERFNTAATLGNDARWRRRAVAAAEVRGTDVVVDLCCGTGDMIRAFAGLPTPPKLIIGVDFAAGMLRHAELQRMRTALQLIRANALRLPLADEVADVVSCAFGVRNFAALQAGLVEMVRIARPGARIVILEFATPANALVRWSYELYCQSVLPRLGSWISGDRNGAYRYLPRSIQTFESTAGMVRRMEEAGLSQVTARRMNFGGVVLYRGVK